MRFLVILNRDGGTLRTTDLAAFEGRMRALLQEAGHDVEVQIVDGGDLERALDHAVATHHIDAIIAGGGDGTTSAAAGKLMRTDKALAVLPAGTMNLFARSLGIPIDLDEAVRAFATGSVRNVDVACANGRPFVHQLSIGLHARVVQLRSRMEYGSRLGKMIASLRAALAAVASPPTLEVSLNLGNAEVVARTSGIGISNNLFGEGHLPYTDRPDGGVLGIYVFSAGTRWDVIRLFANIVIGRWSDNDQVEIHEAQRVAMRVRSPLRRHLCVIDGELASLERETVVEIHPRSLRVIVPTAQSTAPADSAVRGASSINSP